MSSNIENRGQGILKSAKKGTKTPGLGGGKRRGGTSGKRDFAVCIEDVMRACTEDETLVEDVSKLLATFEGADAEMNEYASQDFRDFWSEFTIGFENAVKA